MTRDELIAKLKTFPSDMIFLVASDEEGNSYREASLGDLELAVDEEYEWNVLHPDDIRAGEYDQEYMDSAKHVAIFW